MNEYLLFVFCLLSVVAFSQSRKYDVTNLNSPGNYQPNTVDSKHGIDNFNVSIRDGSISHSYLRLSSGGNHKSTLSGGIGNLHSYFDSPSLFGNLNLDVYLFSLGNVGDVLIDGDVYYHSWKDEPIDDGIILGFLGAKYRTPRFWNVFEFEVAPGYLFSHLRSSDGRNAHDLKKGLGWNTENYPNYLNYRDGFAASFTLNVHLSERFAIYIKDLTNFKFIGENANPYSSEKVDNGYPSKSDGVLSIGGCELLS